MQSSIVVLLVAILVAGLAGCAGLVSSTGTKSQTQPEQLAPSITSLNPSSGAIGTAVTISGANFGSSQSSSTVVFNGVTGTPTSWSATSIVVPVPAGATTGSVVVTVGGLASNAVAFTVSTTAPSISGINPSSGTIGTVVTISGANFGATQGTSTAKFNGVAAAPTSWSATSIVVPVPAGTTSGNVVVTVGGVASNGVGFTVAASAPTISSVNPTSGLVGAVVTITGTNFGTTQGTSTVKFNGTTATPTSWTATSIATTVPTGATTGSVVVTVGGTASNGVSFTVTAPAPSISSLNPTSGNIGAAVTITGANFGASQGSSTVKFNGIVATPTSWTATSIVVPVPAGATTGNVVVTVGGTASNGLPFTVTNPGPSITGLNPASGVVGTVVTISGVNFGASQGTNTVKFNGTAGSPTSWTATSIVVPVPTGAATGSVVVTVGGVASNGVTFTVTLPAPTISGLNPTSGVVGTAVTITGANFGAAQGTSTVTFNGAAATPTSWSATSIVAPVPTGATTGNVVVTVSGAASNGVTFTVTVPTPNISSLSPNSGQASASVTIAGTNFGATKGSSTVKFNGTAATPTTWSATSIVVPVPATATSGNVVVTVSSTASNGVAFTVLADTTAPSVPTGLSATAMSSSQISLSWTASTDNVGVTGYNVFRGGTKIGTTATASYADSGLSASTTYTYTVSAFDAAGNTSAQSASASATTFATSTASGAPYIPAGQGWHDLGAATQLQASQGVNENPALCSPNGYLSSGYGFTDDCANAYIAWNSGAWDDNDEYMILAAQGGHTDYNGNDVWLLKIGQPTPALVQAVLPTIPISSNTPSFGYIPDNGGASTNCNSTTKVNGFNVCPNARHTYDGVEYIPSTGQLMLEGGAVGPNGPMRSIDNWLLDMANLTWTRIDTCGNGLVGQSCGGQTRPGSAGEIVDLATMAYDSSSKNVYYINAYNNDFWEYNTSNQQWTKLVTGLLPGGYGEYMVSSVDPVNHRMIAIQAQTSGQIVDAISLTSPYTVTDETSKCTLASSFNGAGTAPAITYDSAIQQFIIIPSSLGNTVYEMDPNTFACKALTFSTAAGNSAINGPSDPSAGVTGSFILGKRASYSAKEDAIIIAGGPYQHAYALRLTPFAASDFANRCAAAGVILCDNFDTAAQFTHSPNYPNVSPTVRYSNQDSGAQEIFQDTTTMASGLSSLEIACPSGIGADCSGGWWTWLCQSKQCSVGPSQNGATDDYNEIYFQFRMREDSQLANTDWESVVGSSPKHFDLFNVQAGSCSSEELTMIRQGDGGLNGFFDVYGGCGGWGYVSYNGPNGASWAPDGSVSPAYYESNESGDSPAYQCQYPSFAAPCAYEKNFANNWVTIQVHLKLNSWDGNPNIGSGTNVLEMWVAAPGQPFEHWKYFPGTAFFQQQGNGFKGFDTLLFEDYMTSASTSVSFPTAHMWIDELIISTKPINTPHGVAP